MATKFYASENTHLIFCQHKGLTFGIIERLSFSILRPRKTAPECYVGALQFKSIYLLPNDPVNDFDIHIICKDSTGKIWDEKIPNVTIMSVNEICYIKDLDPSTNSFIAKGYQTGE